MADKIKRKKSTQRFRELPRRAELSEAAARMRFPPFSTPERELPFFTCTLSPLGAQLSLLAPADQGLQHHLA